MQIYKVKLETLQEEIKSQLPKLENKKANNLIENAAQLFLSIGLMATALNAYENQKDGFKENIVTSFAEFESYFNELMEFGDCFLDECNKIR